VDVLVHFPFRCGADLSDAFRQLRARGELETAAQANDSERRVANVSREIDSQAPEIAAGRQKSRDLRASPRHYTAMENALASGPAYSIQ
jgi:hypothetical protein